jgi:hypothetical protein
MGLYTVAYGATTFSFDIVKPPQRQLSYGEDMGETWSIEGVLISSDGTINTLNTEIAVIIAAMRLHDQTLVIQRNSQTVLTTASNAGYNVRGHFQKSGAPDFDLGASQKFTLTFSFTLPMTQTSSDVWSTSYQGRKLVKVSQGFGPQRRRIIRIGCVYTMTPGASPKTAKENYDANHATWCAAILADVTGPGNVQDPQYAGAAVGQYDLVNEDLGDRNRIDAEISVVSTFQELLTDDDDVSSGTPKQNAFLTDTKWGFMRKHGNRFGRSVISGGPKNNDMPVHVSAEYNAFVSWTQLDSGSRLDLHAAFSTYIRGILVSRARTTMDLSTSTWYAIAGPLTFHATPSDRSLRATMDIVFVKNSNGGVVTQSGAGASPALWLEFNEEFEVDQDNKNRYRKILDGGQDTYDVYSPGRMVTARITTTAMTYRTEAPPPPTLGGGWNMDRSTKRVSSYWVDAQDTRSGANAWTTAQAEKVFLTVYTTTYTLVSAGDRDTAAFGPQLIYPKPQAPGKFSGSGGGYGSHGKNIDEGEGRALPLQGGSGGIILGVPGGG